MAWTAPIGIPHQGTWFEKTTGDVTEVTSGSTSGNTTFSGTGTADNPKIFRGVGTPTFSGTGYVYISGNYVIVEGIKVSSNRVIRFDGSYVCLRDSEVTGNGGNTSKGTVSSLATASYVVIYNNTIHDNGPWDGGTENDIHGVTGTPGCHHIWIVDNLMYHHGGDSVQFGHTDSNTTHHVFVGRNEMYTDRENAVDIKRISDVVISQNTMHDYVTSSTSEGAAVVVHYCQSNSNVIFNTIYNCTVGISDTSLDNCSISPLIVRHMGNLMYDCGRGIQTWGSGKRITIANNTMYNLVTGGIDCTNLGSGSLIENNLLQSVSGSQIVATGSYTSRNNITSTTDAKLINPAALNFRLQSTSPAINAGVTPQGYADFAAYFGESILFDHDGNPRPINTWDIGAYEYVEGGLPPNCEIALTVS
jgi:hypothetical protein